MLMNLIRNELFKQVIGKKVYIFLAVIIGFNLLAIFEDMLGHVDFIMNGPNLPIYMLSTIANYILPFYIIFVVTEMIAHEYQAGTLKISLLAPVKRSTVLSAKIIALSILLLFLLLFSYIMSIIIGTVYWGWSDAVVFEDLSLITEPIQYPLIKGIVLGVSAYVVSLFPLMAFAILVIWISFKFNTSGLAVGVSISLLIFMGAMIQIIPLASPAFILNYFTLGILFFNPDRFSLIAAILSILSYFILFSFLSYQHFKKKDIFL